MSFDLVDRRWLPVERDGRDIRVSLRESLTDAHEIRGLAPPRPTLVPALLRQLLVAVVLTACGIPRSLDEWAAWWRAGRLDREAINRYLDEYRDHFDLFHPERPFAQVAGLRTTKGETKPSSLLVPSVNVGNNVPLFSARTEAEPLDLTPGEAAMWLLHTHCWDTAAIKTGAVGDPRVKGGKTTGNPTGPLGQLGVVVPLGRSLFETLLLNILHRPDGLPEGDCPQWHAEPATPAWTTRGALGPLDLFTWQARRIRLFPSDGPDGPVVREVIVAAGDRLDVLPEYEPHTVWALEPRPKAGQPPVRPRRWRSGRNAWQGLDALLAIDPPNDGTMRTGALLEQAADLVDVLGDDYPLGVLTVGVAYGSQWAVVDHVIADELPLPVAALREDASLQEALRDMVNNTDALARIMNDLDGDLRRACGGDPVPWDRGQRPGVELIQRLDPVVRRLLVDLQSRPERQADAELAFQRIAYRVALEIADRLLQGVPPSAFGGRRDDARKRDFRPANAEAVFRRRVAATLPDRFMEEAS